MSPNCLLTHVRFTLVLWLLLTISCSTAKDAGPDVSVEDVTPSPAITDVEQKDEGFAPEVVPGDVEDLDDGFLCPSNTSGPLPAEVYAPMEPCLAPSHLSGSYTNLTTASELPPLNPIDPGLYTNDFTTGIDPEHTAAIFVDLDGDGRPEILEYGVSCSTGIPMPRALRYDPVEKKLSVFPYQPPKERPMAAADLDGDGHVDLALGRGRPAFLWGPLQAQQTYLNLDGVQPDLACVGVHGIQLSDYDNDGFLDILVSLSNCDAENLEPGPSVRLYINQGNRTFEDMTDTLLDGSADSSGYAAFMTTLGISRRLLVTAPLPCGSYGALGFFEPIGLTEAGYPIYSDFDPEIDSDGFRLAVPDHEKNMPLWYFGPMGMVTGDVNNDGNFDLIMALHPFHVLFTSDAQGHLQDKSLSTSFTWLKAPQSEREQFAWGMALLDLDQDGHLDLISAHGDDFLPFEHDQPEAIGPQAITAHWNGGNLAFKDIGPSIGFGDYGNFRGLSYGDLDNDGDPDLVIGGKGRAPTVFLNELSSPNHGFSVELRGTLSNTLGQGAEIYVQPRPGDAEKRYLMGDQASPTNTSENLVFVALGTSEKAHKLRVLWPSSLEVVYTDLEHGKRHVLQEPELLKVTPSHRRSAADGSSVIWVEINTSALAEVSNLDATGEVELAMTHGQGVITKGPSSESGTHEFEVRAPLNPGSSRLSISVGGQVLKIYPRLWWD